MTHTPLTDQQLDVAIANRNPVLFHTINRPARLCIVTEREEQHHLGGSYTSTRACVQLTGWDMCWWVYRDDLSLASAEALLESVEL